jgi:hypothetical protein
MKQTKFFLTLCVTALLCTAALEYRYQSQTNKKVNRAKVDTIRDTIKVDFNHSKI